LDEMPDNVRADVKASLAEAKRGELIPHEEIEQRYSKWLTK
jgi:predicted transcriptional regulator